ncbi:MAG: carbohydrate binding family 9 domain-containing protein [Gemmatimonadales bacterium]|nr:carbohydrate binding family 9 domain-containing protein [Gemmatimonadales bacterium]
MLLPLLLLAAGTDPAVIYNGREGRLEVRPPRLEAAITVDGSLDEPAWAQAAMLTGFSQFTPVDGVPAADSTEILVWYSETAIHFGIRALEAHGKVHATLADRDKIGADDYVQILLSTFDDGRQASVFAVNPFGVQSDGALVETGSTSGNGFNNAVVRREFADLSPDFVFESKGRLTAYGYEVEVRIPFKSLRFQPAREQRWGINVTRQVQHSGAEDSWAPATRSSASFLAQSGHLVGLTGLRRGLVLEFNPSLTSKTTGAPGTNGWRYAGGGPELGGSIRWGITNNLNLNATANPDFSQVESDAGQFLFDPRNELFFSEKRPFFLDGIEQFTTPNSLIYTRRIVQPVASAKLTGKAFGTDIALLSAVDDAAVSASGDEHPVYNLLRLQRDVGAKSRLGMVYADRIVGGDFNRVAGLDARLLFGELYSVNLQMAGSHTRTGDATSTAPLWYARLARNGRTFGFRAQINGSDPDFRARSGFFPRPGLSHVNLDPRVTWYGRSGSLVESVTGDVNLDGLYRYDQFGTTAGMQEEKIHVNTNVRLRGGWTAGASMLIEQFGYPSEVYGGYRIELPRAGTGVDTVPFVGRPAIPNRDYVSGAAGSWSTRSRWPPRATRRRLRGSRSDGWATPTGPRSRAW